MAAIELNNVSVHFHVHTAASRSVKHALLRAGTGGIISSGGGRAVLVQALRNISLRIDHGSRIGLIGPNGAGKSTLLRVMAGIYEPRVGHLRVEGRVSPMFDINMGMDPESTGLENIFMRGAFIGLRHSEIAARVAEIREFSELGDYLGLPVHTYSGGMRLRLAFATSTSFQPDILLMDEGILAGDAHFIEKASKRLERFISGSNIFVLASHSEGLIRRFCTHVALIEAGELICQGDPDTIFDIYRQRILGERPLVKRLYQVGGRRFVLRTNWQEYSLDSSFTPDGSYEPWVVTILGDILAAHERPVVIDVGANVGAIALACSAIAPQGTVYAFEALPHIAEVLQENLVANAIENVHVITLACSDTSGTLRISLPPDKSLGGVQILEPEQVPDASAVVREVQAGSLDHWAAEAGLERLDCIKIDVEGWESRVLSGASATIRKYRPAAIVEFQAIESTLAGQDKALDLFRTLADQFDHVFLIDRMGATLVPVHSYAHLRSLMLTGHQIEDLLCLDDDRLGQRLRDRIAPFSVYPTFHASRTVQTDRGLLSLLQSYGDGWNHGQTMAIVGGLTGTVRVSARLWWHRDEDGATNQVLVYRNNDKTVIELNDKRANLELEIAPGNSYFFWCSKARWAREVWHNDDPRLVGFNLEIVGIR